MVPQAFTSVRRSLRFVLARTERSCGRLASFLLTRQHTIATFRDLVEMSSRTTSVAHCRHRTSRRPLPPRLPQLLARRNGKSGKKGKTP